MRKMSVVWKSCIVLCALEGILLQMGIMSGTLSFYSFRMFTVLSNALTVIYYVLAIAAGSGRGAWCPALKLMMVVSILLTGGVSFVMLQDLMVGASDIQRLSLILMHDVVPIAVLVDWLFMDSHGSLRISDPILALFPAGLYSAVALIGAQFGYGLGSKGSRYPYPFMDIDQRGLVPVLITEAILLVILLAVGFLLYGIDRWASSGGRRK